MLVGYRQVHLCTISRKQSTRLMRRQCGLAGRKPRRRMADATARLANMLSLLFRPAHR